MSRITSSSIPSRVVAARQLRRIARRAQPLEVDALDDLPVADVEAGDDALREHGRSQTHVLRLDPCVQHASAGSCAGSAARRRRISRDGTARPPTWPRCTTAANGSPCSVIGDGVAGHRRHVAVREVDLRPVVDAVDDRRRRAGSSRLFQPTCGILTTGPLRPRPCRAGSSGQRAGRGPAAPAPRRCPRTATACRGRCRAAAALRRRARGSRRSTSRSSARRRAEVADAGHDDAGGAGELVRRVRHEDVGADRRRAPSSPTSGCRPCSRSARSQQPLRARQHAREARDPSRTATRSARANALNTASILVMARAAVEHLDVHVGARADARSLRRNRARARSADRRRARRCTCRSTTACGRPPRSIAATASVSSIGMTK